MAWDSLTATDSAHELLTDCIESLTADPTPWASTDWKMAAVRLATVQAVFLSVILVSALFVCKVSCIIQYTRSELLNLRSTSHSDLGPSTSLLEKKLLELNIQRKPLNTMAAGPKGPPLRHLCQVQETPLQVFQFKS
ncbi:unnamed protein product [Arctogadus glacialis]